MRSVIYPKIVKKCYSSCDKDSEDIKFAENGIRMRKLWLFEVELEVECYFEKIKSRLTLTITT